MVRSGGHLPASSDGESGRLKSATINASALAYWQQGPAGGRTLVMLHGLGSDHRGLLDLAERLRGIRVVAPDLPGFGHSVSLPGRHTLDRYADVLEGLRQHLGLDRFALLGHSLGADIAMVYASTYPAAVSDLCLLNPVFDTTGATVRLSRLFCRVCATVPPRVGRLLLSNRLTVYLQDRATFTSPDPATRRRILHQDYRTARMADPRAMHESVGSLHDPLLGRYVRNIRARTLMVTGSLDWLATPGSLSGLPWPQARPVLTVVPGAGHLLPVEQPDLVAAIVNRFLDAE